MDWCVYGRCGHGDRGVLVFTFAKGDKKGGSQAESRLCYVNFASVLLAFFLYCHYGRDREYPEQSYKWQRVAPAAAVAHAAVVYSPGVRFVGRGIGKFHFVNIVIV